MALVFISHAHSDRSLARGLCSLLRDALGLNPEDFFMSSEKGRGVAPAADIRDEIQGALSKARVLIVLLTPKSALSRWVWLEAGTRLGQPGAANPLFVCPSERFTSLLGPLGSTKALNIDHEDELVELIQAVGRSLERTPREYLSYKPALADLAGLARSEYSTARERRANALSWGIRLSPTLLLAALALMVGVWYGSSSLETFRQQAAISEVQRNQETSAMAARYLILTGTVNSQDGNKPISEAVVMASKDQTVREQSACLEPQCTFGRTHTNGEFRIDLTRIQAEKEDLITLIVAKPGFEVVSEPLRVDVRAMDVKVAPQIVRLSPAVPPLVPRGVSQ
jgi:hypothetical protein